MLHPRSLHIQPVLTLFPPESNEDDMPMTPQQIMSTITVLIVVVVCILAIALCVWKRFRFASNVLRNCFPWFPASTYHRGIAKADIFVEITRVSVQKAHGHILRKLNVTLHCSRERAI